MASITSLSNSSYISNSSSIYGNKNIISGLASGMDTEQMIQNAVSGYKLKIQNLQKKRTKIEWQQEAYRSIIDKAVDFNRKYTSYSSKTNLLSGSFFNNAVNTVASGTYADKITATGKTTSDIKINSVSKMAQAATYKVTGSATGLGQKLAAAAGGEALGIKGEQVDLSKELDVNNLSGSLTFQYGGSNGTSFNISFGELEDWSQYEGDTKAEQLANAINKKLSEVTYNYTKNGLQESTTADKAIKATAGEDGKIYFSDELGNGNKVSISYASGDIKDALGISKDDTSIDVSKIEESGLSKKVSTYEYLGGKQDDKGTWSGGKELSVTFNGTTKKISMSDVMNKVEEDTRNDKSQDQKFVDALNGELEKAFGKDKVVVDQNPDGGLSFTPAQGGDTLSIGGSATKALGFGDGDANYINTGKKLSDLMGDDAFADNNRVTAVGTNVTESSNGTYFDEAGNRVKKGDDGNFYRVNNDGEFLYSFEINDAKINITKDTTLESLMNSINSNADAGVKVSYSKLTNEFKFTATETGANSKIEFGGLAKEMFGDPKSDPDNYTAGQDAVMDVEINGKHFTNFTRSTNSFDIDGLNITLKGTFEEVGKDGKDYEAITFTSSTDSDKIVDAIKSFVEDYNAMATEIKNAYSTMPQTNSSGNRYEPLTSEEEEKYSESELKAYNERAKQGVLFGDSTLSSMYSKLLSAIQPGGADGSALRAIGIDTSYSNGVATLSLDEDKLRAALDSNPDKVRDAFSKTKEGGSSSDGLMQNLQNTLNAYVKDTGEPKGILITQAGSIKVPTSLNNNSLKSQMDSIDTQIDRWTDKMSSQIDRYTSKFSKLEQLIAQMNSQSSALSGLMGGSSGY